MPGISIITTRDFRGNGVSGERQRAYLERMGVPVWVRRHRPGPDADEATDQATAAREEIPAPQSDPAGECATGAPPAAVESEAPSRARAITGDGGEAEPPPSGDEQAWERLREEVVDCTACPLHESRTQAVFGVGCHSADLMIVGEAPGAEEDRRGEPFVGRAGRLLDEMLRAIDLSRDGVYITNILKSRPPGNRDPRPEEIAACEGYLRRQIELVRPRVLLAVGRIAAQHLVGSDQPLGRLRGRWHQYGPRQTPLLATYHPAYLLRSPAQKAKAWQDLKQVRDRLREEERVS